MEHVSVHTAVWLTRQLWPGIWTSAIERAVHQGYASMNRQELIDTLDTLTAERMRRLGL